MYSTTDFYTTAVLITCGFKLKDVQGEGPDQRVKRFFFEDHPGLRTTVLEYTNGTLVGNLRGMRNSIEIVKDLVHAR